MWALEAKEQYRLYKWEDYADFIREEVSKKPYLVQELIPNGHDVQGTFYLYHNGEMVDAYSHQGFEPLLLLVV